MGLLGKTGVDKMGLLRKFVDEIGVDEMGEDQMGCYRTGKMGMLTENAQHSHLA